MTLKNRILNLLKLFFSIFNYEIEIKKNNFTFMGIYKSYKEAFLASNNLDKYVNKDYQTKKGLENLETIEISGKFHIFTVFCALILNDKQNEKDYEFLEVGGGDNPIFLHILKSTNKKIRCQVLEEKNFKIEISNENKNYISYHNKIENINFQNLSSVIFSGSIQYMENYMDILDKVFEKNIEYIFIVETFFTNKNESIFTLQSNMMNTQFPNIFFSLNELNSIFEKNSYKQIYITKRKVNQYSHDKLNGQEYFVRDLIYKLI
tara:strand:- start:120 stop:908 length:789 start_codon:yes stop_codon:yes gene_type:complete